MPNELSRSTSRSLSPFGGSTLRPFSPLREMTDWMNQAVAGDMPATGARQWIPAVEVRQRDNNIIVSADLPGIDQKDVKVEVQDHTLVIQGERKEERTEQRQGWRRSEMSYGSFFRAIPLPESARPDQAKADFRNGVLEITVPVTEAKSNRREIPVTTK